MNDTTLGIIAVAVPLVIIGFFALRRLPWVFAFFLALIAVGIGYLQTTGATKDIGHKVRESLPAGILPEHKQAEEAPADGGAMKALPPPAETAPPAAPAPAPAPAPEAAPATPPAAPPAAESTPPAAPAPEAAPATPPAEPAPSPAPAPETKPENATPPATPAPANP